MASVDNYDVFINFRGADTRHGFVKILYDSLVAEGIRVFLDDEELNYGKRLDEVLPQAIKNSKIYITVISERYASSKWCLRELVEIVRNKQEFKDKKEILPIFYKITPEDVKLKTDLFKNQLKSLINENVTAETVEAWGITLKGIADLKAWKVSIDGGYKEDGECCHEIVKRASIILRVKHKPLPKDLIAMENPVEEVMQLLNIRNPSFQVIGILGMGGSGKTTLAKVVYNKLCDDKFDCCCFMPDVRESLDKDKGSRSCLELQKKLLKEVSYRGDVDKIRDDEDGVRKIQLTLQGKKVLMVFDDVSKADQILRLIGDDYTMFGRESRVIITTRDDRVLHNRKFVEFTKIHEMEAMENEHALELFSWNAFGEPMPPSDYVELSKAAVSLTGRLPLSLEITGSLFFVGGRKNWKRTVEKLKKMPNKKVQDRLKISYDDLEEETREIFLDIACFFVDKQVSHETHMWSACDFYPELAIEELVSMCLLKIDKKDIYRMHDHIKDLGREIVRQEGPEYKEQRSRIWKKQDSIDMLTSMKKESNIKGILLGYGRKDDEIWTLRAENFVNLDKLRFLQLKDGDIIDGSFKNLLPNLRWLSLSWRLVERFNATDFNLKKLVVLNLSYTRVTESWAGWKEFKNLPSLEVLDLSECSTLKKTPDLSHCMCLKKLVLVGCSRLEEIDRSIIYLKALEYLDLRGCHSLKKLPADDFTHVQLEDSTRVQGFKLQIPSSIGAGLVNLEHLSLRNCKSLESLPNSITSLPKLQTLNIAYCRSLESLPDSVGEIMVLQLTELDISHCERLKKLPGFISKQKKLEVLQATDNKGMEGIPTEIEELTCLREMSFKGSSISGLPSLVKLTRLEKLNLEGCYHLRQLPAELPASLLQLCVTSKSLLSIPDYSYLIHLTKLKLRLEGFLGPYSNKIYELNLSWVWRLSKLKSLEIRCCWLYYRTTIQSEEPSASLLSQLEELNLGVAGTCVLPSCLPALTRLEISLYWKTKSVSLPRMNCLTHLKLSFCYDLEQILGLGELESLVSLELTRCKSLERLDDISKLRQLQTLDISECKRLRVISIVPCLQSLKRLHIWKCKSLESLVGESESCVDNILQGIERWSISCCGRLGNNLPDDLKRKLEKEEEEYQRWKEAGRPMYYD